MALSMLVETCTGWLPAVAILHLLPQVLITV